MGRTDLALSCLGCMIFPLLLFKFGIGLFVEECFVPQAHWKAQQVRVSLFTPGRFTYSFGSGRTKLEVHLDKLYQALRSLALFYSNIT